MKLKCQEMLAMLGDYVDGELDPEVYEAFTRLTLKTSTHCLMGEDFRYTLTDEFADLYHELEHSVSPAALRDPDNLGEVSARRDRARAGRRPALQALTTSPPGESAGTAAPRPRRSGRAPPDNPTPTAARA